MTREEAYKKCLSVVKNELVAQVLVDKYLLCSEDQNYVESNPEEMWKRLANAIVEAERPEVREHWSRRFYEVLKDFKFVPGGRILYGLGNRFVDVTLKNCYVVGIQEDSIRGIFDCAYQMAETFKSGGGVGTDISILRPKNSPVRNAARVSSGSVNFMDFYSHITGMIGQKGRVGALLISMRVDHPDIEDFINVKGGDDLDKVRFANVSVKITDEFMHAVSDDQDIDLVWGGKTYKTVKARELWNLIVERAWRRAEPGLLFWNAILREYPSAQYDEFRPLTTNPCVTGDMRLLTSNGYKLVRELWAEGGFQEYDGEPSIEKHGELKVVNSDGPTLATNVYRTSECADVYRITLVNGRTIDATENHKFLTLGDKEEQIRKQLGELREGDKLILSGEDGVFGNFEYPQYARLAGWVIGDGSLAYNRKTGYQRAHVTTWDKDIEMCQPTLRADLMAVYQRSNRSTEQNPDYSGGSRKPKGFQHAINTMQSMVLGRLLREDGLWPGNKHVVPKSIWQGDAATIAAFLQGFFSVDGGVQTNERKKCISIRATQVRLPFLEECQLLLGQFGITSTVYPYRRGATKKLMNDGKGGMKLYNKQAEHELVISGIENCRLFKEKIGFIQGFKNDLIENWLSTHDGSNNSKTRYWSEIADIRYLGQEETFCLTEPKKHEIVVNGIRTGNCGELNLSHGGSCCLGSMNLSKYVRNSWEENCYFDYEALEDDVKVAVRFLDNIISLEKSPMEFQQWTNDNGRRIGLGIMGLADVFMRMKMRFDSEAALVLAKRITESWMVAAYDESCNLAVEKGPFPAFSADKHLKCDFVNRLPEALKGRIAKDGIRNIGLQAIAPTGSISTISQCSSSLEPAFKIHYIRKTKNLGATKKTTEHEVWHNTAQEYAEKFHCKVEEMPEFFQGAHQINHESRIKMQGIIQRNCDQSISSTINLPKEATIEQVGALYVDAWRQGLKGITVYRDGSREGVLIDVKERKDEPSAITIHKAPRRPESIDAKVHVIRPNGRAFTVFVGLLGGRVYEVFALDYKLAGISDGMAGKIVKTRENKEKVYNFEAGALVVRKLNAYEDSEASLVTRLISTALRHGTPLEFIIDQISQSKLIVNSFPRAIAKALTLYVRQEEIIGVFKCNKCGSDDIHWEGLCRTCRQCGESACT